MIGTSFGLAVGSRPVHAASMERIAIIGYGEAASAFVAGGLPAAIAYDVDPRKRRGIATAQSPREALDGATLILSLVTADQALRVAREASVMPGALWCDMNSVASDTKRAAAEAIGAVGGRYLDAAIMAPVKPAQLSVPLLVSGEHAERGAARLTAVGFNDVRAVGNAVGRASAIKLIRSIMVKGIEALTAEMLLASEAAGVSDEVLTSLDGKWIVKAGYNLERMTHHGVRRAAEMEEAVRMLEALGIAPAMTRGTVARQRAIGLAHELTDIAA